ncbi:hypothetical protein CY34DRAFT_530848 [Suillus luteus UH-Slu-Lm8-n1]|uniref:Uncharacterized protein n=1 Tax=Suillus luteus UH-Slu-Lm8-n1 TaxID=930992 RepID=A0A0D0A5X9_9AGAM|nr:hypothetical protein CY34DRAFT_530848 [Suillus luteus UH-Slu-Lm8-n1]
MITLCQTSYSTLAFRRQTHNSSVNMQELWPHTFHVVFIAGYSLDGDALLSCCDISAIHASSSSFWTKILTIRHLGGTSIPLYERAEKSILPVG